MFQQILSIQDIIFMKLMILKKNCGKYGHHRILRKSKINPHVLISEWETTVIALNIDKIQVIDRNYTVSQCSAQTVQLQEMAADS